MRFLGLAMLGIREKRAWITRLGVIRGKRRQGTNSRLVTHLLKQACHKFASSPGPSKLDLSPMEIMEIKTLGYREAVHLLEIRTSVPSSIDEKESLLAV